MSVYTILGASGDAAVVLSSSGSGSVLVPPNLAPASFASASAFGSGSATVSVPAFSAASSASGSGPTPGDASSFYNDLTSTGGKGRYMGCYVDERFAGMLRGDSMSSGNMTPARCTAFCSDHEHDVFNLQYDTD